LIKRSIFSKKYKMIVDNKFCCEFMTSPFINERDLDAKINTNASNSTATPTPLAPASTNGAAVTTSGTIVSGTNAGSKPTNQ
jgi:hypothetical protein